MTHQKHWLFQIPIPTTTQSSIREKFLQLLSAPPSFAHVVSLNPEIMVLAYENEEFRAILQSADIRLIDGIGVFWAARLRGIPVQHRYTGVDFMQDVIDAISDYRSTVLFLGGSAGVAEKLVACYQKSHPNLTFHSLYGSENIKKDQDGADSAAILAQIKVWKPRVIFVSFGSPVQEEWIWNHRDQLEGAICIGVGGAFDFVSGAVERAPIAVQRLGLEWLYRLMRQPWRWQRQLRLIRFISMVVWGR